MATIGLRDLYRAPITVGEDGEETYGTPVRMAKAISAEMSVEVAEAILYADDGADEVEVTAPVAHIRDGNFSYVKKEFKKLRKAVKNKSLRVDLECNLLSHEQILRACTLAADCGVNSIKTSSSALSGGNEIERINEIKSAVKDKCTIKAEGVATVLEMSSAIDTGASVIGSKNAADVARAILAAADADF